MNIIIQKSLSVFSALMMTAYPLSVNASDSFTSEMSFSNDNRVQNTEEIQYLGDLNSDGTLDIKDLIIISEYLNGSSADSASLSDTADINSDSVINICDCILIKSMILHETEWIYADSSNSSGTDSRSDFINACTDELNNSLKSHGKGAMCIIAIDFPDCKFKQDYSTEDFENAAFGECNDQSPSYPFESIAAYYRRASKEAFDLVGKAYRYSSSESVKRYKSTTNVWYGTDKIIHETIKALDPVIDFSDFDLNKDGYIDSMLFVLPAASGKDDWWPVSNSYKFEKFGADNVFVGNYTTGNIEPDDISNFASLYSHELGHQLGLPDYYLYTDDEDYEGFHGSAGTELMDTDAKSDLCSFSKLMLGWFREDQVLYFDRSKGKMTFELNSAQTDEGNCIIIPAFNNKNNCLTGEYFIVEYNTDRYNNSVVGNLKSQDIESGVRVFHINAPISDNHIWKYFKYSVGSKEIGNDYTRFRLIRLVNDYNAPFKKGRTISYSTRGFAFYDYSGYETIDPEVFITIDDFRNNKYIVTISEY